MPLAILEAMACGIPVVAMPVGGVAEIVEVGTTGYLSAGGDWIGLGDDAVIKVLENPERKKSMGQSRTGIGSQPFFTLRLLYRGGSNIREVDPILELGWRTTSRR